jgi:hypothetical protein
MNERLHDIMMEATKDMPHGYYWPGEYVEKFAELIVRECALVVHKKTGPKSALNVLEHFGVEE